MAGAHENIGTFKAQEFDLPTAVNYLNSRTKGNNNFFSLYDDNAIKDLIDSGAVKNRKELNDIIKQKTPGQEGNRLLAYIDGNSNLQVTSFNGTIGSFIGVVGRFGNYTTTQKQDLDNMIDNLITNNTDIPTYTDPKSEKPGPPPPPFVN